MNNPYDLPVASLLIATAYLQIAGSVTLKPYPRESIDTQ